MNVVKAWLLYRHDWYFYGKLEAQRRKEKRSR